MKIGKVHKDIKRGWGIGLHCYRRLYRVSDASRRRIQKLARNLRNDNRFIVVIYDRYFVIIRNLTAENSQKNNAS